MFVYILGTSDNKLYVGHTNDLFRRSQDHANSLGAKYIKDHGRFTLVYSEKFGTRADAMKREKQIKRWTRAKKEALIASNLGLLKKL